MHPIPAPVRRTHHSWEEQYTVRVQPRRTGYPTLPCNRRNHNEVRRRPHDNNREANSQASHVAHHNLADTATGTRRPDTAGCQGYTTGLAAIAGRSPAEVSRSTRSSSGSYRTHPRSHPYNSTPPRRRSPRRTGRGCTFHWGGSHHHGSRHRSYTAHRGWRSSSRTGCTTLPRSTSGVAQSRAAGTGS